MLINRADRVLMNEISKIDKKIRNLERDIIKLNAEKKELIEGLSDNSLNYRDE